MGQRIRIRRDTSANWATNNPVLQDGEQGYDKTLKQNKTGDGVLAWLDLPFNKTDYANLVNKPVLYDGTYASLTGKPVLFDGAYASLTGKPDLTTIVIDGGTAAG